MLIEMILWQEIPPGCNATR